MSKIDMLVSTVAGAVVISAGLIFQGAVADAAPAPVPVVTVPPAPGAPVTNPPAKPLTQACLDARLAVDRAVLALNDEATAINRHTKPLTTAQALSAALRSTQAQHDRFVITKAALKGC